MTSTRRWGRFLRRGARAGTPEITVVVVCHNDAGVISASLTSLVSQSLSNFECVVVDRHSTDRTVETAMDSVGGDARFRFVQTEGFATVPAAAAAGLDLARGTFITFLGVGDVLVPDSLAARANVLRTVERGNDNVVGVYCDWAFGERESGLQPPRLDDLPTSTILLSIEGVAAAMATSGQGSASHMIAPDGGAWQHVEHLGVTVSPETSRKGLAFDKPPAVRTIEHRERRLLTAEELGAAVEDAILIMPAVEYHVIEMGPLAEELTKRGHKVYFLISDHRWQGVTQAVQWFDIPILACLEPGEWVRGAAALVTLNDWAEIYRDVILAGQRAGVPTFGKVEGVQDFGDLDVPFERHAYQTVDHVLCQGRNDVAAIGGPNTKYVVGSSRLERVWHEGEVGAAGDLVAINLNFTYGVLEEVRESWLAAAVDACDRASIPYTVSLHPHERPAATYQHVAADPMRHLLATGAMLISRFSTVPFEAMARGVPFVYFNPHRERVPTFQQPRGAFDIATDTTELAAALRSARASKSGFRQRAASFFAEQVDIGSKPSAERAADVMEEVLRW